jgi:molecular chaperone HtpG
MSDSNAFHIGIEFESVLAAISKQIYETPLAFIRENVQNAVDALRLQAAREEVPSSDESLGVWVRLEGQQCEIADDGIGMSLADLRNLFWTIGASGKRTPEARAAGCVGMFGIGGFANLGVCNSLRVISQPADGDSGHWTELSREDIEAAAGGAIPRVRHGPSSDAAPRGTIVRGQLNEQPDREALRAYVQEFVRFADERVYFDGELLSRQPFRAPTEQDGDLRRVPTAEERWTHGETSVRGSLFETPNHSLAAELRELDLAGEPVRIKAWLRFENGPLEVMKRGFKLCTTTIQTQIGLSGAIDCDQLSPTAGRDSLDAESSALIASIAASMEHAAVLAVLDSSERIAQHTRIFRYVRSQGMIEHLGKVVVELADGSEIRLEEVRRRAAAQLRVFFATSKNRELSQLLQTRGHIAVQLPADRDKQIAVRDYLTTYCGAESFEGRIECTEEYDGLSLFERAFLSQLEQTIVSAYDVAAARLIPGRLTEDIPVYAPESKTAELTIYVDVRHSEITKLEPLGISPLLTSMVAAFCREYLGSTLRSKSPKFFGSGAVNLDWLAKRRSELWVLVTDDIHILRQGTQRQVVRASDVRVVQAGGGDSPPEFESGTGEEPRLVKIEGAEDFAQLFGYYLRIPTSATAAYGDVIQQCDARAAVWAGNKLLFVASDAISTAFQYEVRLERIVVTTGETGPVAGGASQIERPLQGLFGGLYFPVPEQLEPYLVPRENQEIRIEVRCDWIDFTSARAWEPAATETDAA